MTNQRGLVLTNGTSFWCRNPVPTGVLREIEFTPGQLLRGQLRRVMGFSRVDLIFTTEVRRGHKGSYTVYFGFFGLENPEEVEALIARTFRVPC